MLFIDGCALWIMRSSEVCVEFRAMPLLLLVEPEKVAVGYSSCATGRFCGCGAASEPALLADPRRSAI